MILFYYVLALIAWCFGAVFLLLLSFKEKYKISIPARFFLVNNPKFKSSKVHFHACSFGEVRALEPILKLFDDKAISVITKTGFDEASKICANTRFLPFEIFLPFWLKRSEILVIFEAELWLMLVFWAKSKCSRVILVNARISDRSYKRYLKFAFFYKKIFSFIDAVYAQSEIDCERLKELGAKNITVCGNIKSANVSAPTKFYTKPKERLIVLASTHDGEEEMILNAINLKENDKILIAPRHPERFNEVGEKVSVWAKRHGFSFEKFSQSGEINAKVNLLDTLGELINFYAISDIVILGGSFVPNVGGHNPIEVAQFNNVIISGEYVFNQNALFSLVEGVKFAKVNELDALINSDLLLSKIAQKADISTIIDDIRKHYER